MEHLTLTVLALKSAVSAEDVVRSKARSTSAVSRAEREINKYARDMPATYSAEHLEKYQSVAAMYAFTKKTFDALIMHGKKYTKLEGTLKAELDAFDPAIATRIDNAIRNHYSIDKVMADIFGKDLVVDYAGALDELSSTLKLDPRILTDLFSAYPGLEERIKNIKDVKEIEPLFDEFRRGIEDTHDQRLGTEIQTRVAEVLNRVGSAKATETFRLMDEKAAKAEEFYMRHTKLMVDAFAKMDELKAMGASNEQIQKYWNGVRGMSDRMFQRANAMDYATLKGMMDAFDLEKPGTAKFLGDITAQYKTWQDYYRLVKDEWNKFYKNYKNLKTKEEKQIAYDTVNKVLDEAYSNVVSDVANRQQIMDGDLVEMMKAKFDEPSIADETLKWRQSLASFVQERGKLIQSEREKIRKIKNVDEQRAEWIRFCQEELLPMVRDHFNLDHQGLARMYEAMTGKPLPEEAKGTRVEQPELVKEKPTEPEIKTTPEFLAANYVEDVGWMRQSLDYIDKPGKSGVLIETDEGFTRLASGYPDWYSKYGFSAAEYHGKKGLGALQEALDYLTAHNGQPELKPDGKPFAIFDRIEVCVNSEGSANLIRSAMENPDAVLAERDARLAHLKEVRKVVENPNSKKGLPEATDEPRAMTPEEAASGEPVGHLPAGIAEDMVHKMPLGEMGADAWYDYTLPMVNQLESILLRRGMVGGTAMPDPLKQKVEKYITRDIAADFAVAKAASMGYGTAMRDYSLINYSDQRGFDNLLTAIFPYQFWLTRSALNWMMRAYDHPAWFANYYRMRNFMRSAQTKPGFPSRLKDTIRMPAPFLPEWAGDSMYFDPLQNIFPFQQFGNGFEMLTQQYSQEQKDAMNLLYSWKNEGTITQAQLEGALKDQNGDLFKRALAQAKSDASDGKFNPFQFIQMFIGPAMYLTVPYYLATGQKEKISVTPFTKTGQGLQAVTQGTALEGLGKIAGEFMAMPETKFREAIGVSEFGEYGPYYIERQLANMVGDGTANYKDALQAMMEKSGPLYEEARRRVMLETAARQPGAMTTYALLHTPAKDWLNPDEMGAALMFGVYPASILPKGELIERGLYDEYKAVGKAFQAGDRDAYDKFFEEYPEYKARLALFDDPQTRLREFLISEIWEKREALGKTQRDMFADIAGQEFQDNFLDDQTRNYELVDTETLAAWAKMIGGLVPNTAETQGVIEDPDINTDALNQASPEVYAEVDAYKSTRNKMFPNWYALQERYYNYPEGSQERKDFLAQFSELKDYWDWNRNFKASHPNIALFTTPPEDQPVEPQYDTTFAKELTPTVVRQLYSYFYADKPLNDGALAELNRIWRKYNYPGDSFQNFIDGVIGSLIAPPTAQQ